MVDEMETFDPDRRGHTLASMRVAKGTTKISLRPLGRRFGYFPAVRTHQAAFSVTIPERPPLALLGWRPVRPARLMRGGNESNQSSESWGGSSTAAPAEGKSGRVAVPRTPPDVSLLFSVVVFLFLLVSF